MTLYFGEEAKHMEEYYMMWLSRIPSIGVHKAMLLLDYFGTAENIWKASFSDLREVKGIGTFYCQTIKEAKKEQQLEKWIEELEEKNILFCDTDTALKKYPELFEKYFNHLVNVGENKYTALNGAVWSGGTFIYVPPYTKIDRPLQSYFRLNSANMGQFERTLIIVDEGAELHYMEGCTAPTYSEDSLHAAVVEIFVGKNAKCRYTTIQNWSSDVYNLVTKGQ